VVDRGFRANPDRPAVVDRFEPGISGIKHSGIRSRICTTILQIVELIFSLSLSLYLSISLSPERDY
jgi:hypothetical protein